MDWLTMQLNAILGILSRSFVIELFCWIHFAYFRWGNVIWLNLWLAERFQSRWAFRGRIQLMAERFLNSLIFSIDSLSNSIAFEYLNDFSISRGLAVRGCDCSLRKGANEANAFFWFWQLFEFILWMRLDWVDCWILRFQTNLKHFCKPLGFAFHPNQFQGSWIWVMRNSWLRLMNSDQTLIRRTSSLAVKLPIYEVIFINSDWLSKEKEISTFHHSIGWGEELPLFREGLSQVAGQCSCGADQLSMQIRMHCGRMPRILRDSKAFRRFFRLLDHFEWDRNL